MTEQRYEKLSDFLLDLYTEEDKETYKCPICNEGCWLDAYDIKDGGYSFRVLCTHCRIAWVLVRSDKLDMSVITHYFNKAVEKLRGLGGSK